jgi:hypothetical protein
MTSGIDLLRRRMVLIDAGMFLVFSLLLGRVESQGTFF